MDEIAPIALGALVVLLTLPGTLELALLTLGAALYRRPAPPGMSSGREPPVAVIVPAHNEERSIEACLASLLACDPPAVRTDLVVLADNCSDATAARARAMGVDVLGRDDPSRPGKGPALTFAYGTLLQRGYGAFIIVDADTHVDVNFLTTMTAALTSGADAVQCRYRVDSPHATPAVRLQEVAALAMNVVRPRGRAYWGLSAGALGNGFAVSRATLERVTYRATGAAEDLEYHFELVRAGARVHFADETTVWARAWAERADALAQRARWEGARFRHVVSWLPRLLGQIGHGRLRLIEPALDLMLPPLAFHTALLLAALALPLPWLRLYAAGCLLVVVLHVLMAAALSESRLRALTTLAVAPFYIVLKLSALADIARQARVDARRARPSGRGGGH